ncbi:MAG TPA: excalibur calcium-binding domain-containing protein [Lysobacter sp.]|nr:excalibur calcium-binding domain-containing protein [Lysobacter sp.]
MKNLLILALLAGLAWSGYDKYKTQLASEAGPSHAQVESTASDREDMSSFRCDGRTHCSHMTSCAEAKYFVQHCPNTKMDGNNDGVPCERQWCNQ